MGKTNNVIYLHSDNEDCKDIIDLLNIDSSSVYFSTISLNDILSGTFFDINIVTNMGCY